MFAHLALVALDLERLRGGLVRRRLFDAELPKEGGMTLRPSAAHWFELVTVLKDLARVDGVPIAHRSGGARGA